MGFSRINKALNLVKMISNTNHTKIGSRSSLNGIILTSLLCLREKINLKLVKIDNLVNIQP